MSLVGVTARWSFQCSCLEGMHWGIARHLSPRVQLQLHVSAGSHSA